MILASIIIFKTVLFQAIPSAFFPIKLGSFFENICFGSKEAVILKQELIQGKQMITVLNISETMNHYCKKICT